MSSPDRLRRTAAAFALAAAGLLAIGGCQVRPLYATGTPGESTVGTVAALSSIAVEVKKDRLEQALMNELIFALRGGAPLVEPRYTLRLIVASNEAELAIRARSEVPAAKLVGLQVTYTLTENTSGRAVTTGSVYKTASYDFSSQRFANLRAARDAEDRAAKAAAEDIRLQLATVLATAS